MANEPGILRLVGRLIRSRLREFGREARADARDGYAQFREELEEELQTKREQPETDETSAGRSE